MRQYNQAAFKYIHNFKKKPSHRHPHVLRLPYPKVIHKVIDSDYLKSFKEVLVIGDVHGCYDELMELLKKNEAFGDDVLKIFAGDLINRGPKSEFVLDLLRRKSSSMVAVRGNHEEEILYEHYEILKYPFYRTSRANSWIRYINKKNIELIEQLPFTMSLPSLNAIVVHAGLIPGIILEHNSPYLMLHMRNILDPTHVWEGGLKGTASTSQGAPWADVWWGPEHIYYGHDAKKHPKKYKFATGLDTGCVEGYHLTGLFISGPRTGTFIKVKAFNEVARQRYQNSRRQKEILRTIKRRRRAYEKERKKKEKEKRRCERRQRRERRRTEKRKKKERRKRKKKALKEKFNEKIGKDRTKKTSKDLDHHRSSSRRNR